ncbi:transporter, drug/metabolite exporter family protein [Photobacterium sp. SKA34]|nr:transporter, drug/metabolite exporter family protein [Photobacterium sp. SKA34]
MNSKLLTVSLFISVCLIWGTTWFAMEEALHSIPPIIATGLRFFISGQVLIILAILFNQPLFFQKGNVNGFLLLL